MATEAYTADSAFVLSSSAMPSVRSHVTGGCAFVPGVGQTARSMSFSTITPSIG
ncbi:hypothetical protein [Bradyrhizobium sp. AS23.2]|uniref:hypothetical protein n=1 Tax=Bradyrhizobium sp. AS23.2 TaxID=1680155 RepID=UPI0014304C09|nr:hypothetical protein [Bradyrhizobium sp. AS23.2]